MEQIGSAIIVMIVGMGFVFSFLCIQVLVTVLGAKVAQKFAYLVKEPAKAAKPKAAAATAPSETETAAIIAAALHQAGKL